LPPPLKFKKKLPTAEQQTTNEVTGVVISKAPAKDEETGLAPLKAPKVEQDLTPAVTAPAKDEEPGVAPLKAPKVEQSLTPAVTAPAKDQEPGVAPLNFRVSAEFRREFKTYAAAHDLKLNKLLVLSFHNYRKQRGD